MVMIVEHFSEALHQAIQPPGKADAEPLHSARESAIRLGFHQEVEVVAEDGELDDAKPEAFACARGICNESCFIDWGQFDRRASPAQSVI